MERPSGTALPCQLPKGTPFARRKLCGTAKSLAREVGADGAVHQRRPQDARAVHAGNRCRERHRVGPMGLGLLFGTGLLLTVRTGGFQLRRWGYWMRHTLGAILTDQSVTAHTAREEPAISQFQSLCTALASTIGTGNLVGVATAILSGGAGAVFWMWIMALLGMMTSYAENVLGIYYRRKDPAGGWRGGPMYYLRDGLGGKPGRVLAVLFAAFCALASFGIGNLSQLNSIAGNLKAAFGVPEAVTGAVLAAVSAVILLGGLKRVAAVAERLVPAMALLYIVGALTVVGVHITAVPAALAAILKGAFGLRAAGGGIVGYGLSRAVTWGFKRGAFFQRGRTWLLSDGARGFQRKRAGAARHVGHF